MDSLLRAGEAIKEFIFLLFNNEEVAISIKIVTAIFVTDYYNQFLSTACHKITSALEFETNSFFKLKHRTGSGTYLCLIMKNIQRNKRRFLKPKTQNRRTNGIWIQAPALTNVCCRQYIIKDDLSRQILLTNFY